MPYFVLTTLIGIVATARFETLPDAGILCPLAGLLFAGAFRWRWLRAPVGLLAGMLLFCLHAGDGLAHRLPEGADGGEATAVGEIASIPRKTGPGLRFRFRVDEYDGPAGARPPRQFRVTWYGGAPELRPGEQWKLRMRVRSPRGFANPGGFDYEGWLFRERLDGTAYVSEGRRLAAPRGWRLLRARAGLLDRLSRAVGDTPGRGMFAALALGYRGDVSDDTYRIFRDTGTGHLLAISGLHVGLAAAVGFMLTGLVWRRWATLTRRFPVQRASAAGALVVALFYAALAGFSIPTQRALVLVAVVAGARLAGRPVRPAVGLAAALLAVLVLDPLSAFSPGLWLSFGAVAALSWGMTGHSRRSRAGRLAVAQLVVAAGLLPLVTLFFGHVPVVAPLVNLVVIPVFSVVVIPLVLAGIAGLAAVPALAGPGIEWLCHGLRVARDGLASVAELAPAAEMAMPPAWTLFLVVPGMIWLLAPRGWPMRWLGAPCLLPFLAVPSELPGPGAARIAFLDVGQGTAVVVRTREHALVFDAGPAFASGSDTGRLVVLPYLRAQGIDRLDRIVISHGDRDHAGGLTVLLERHPEAELLSGEPERLGYGRARYCRRGQAWTWDGVRFEFLHPGPGWRFSGNDASCVLRINTRAGRVLLTGDVERAAERALVGTFPGNDLAADVLQVPHHGSATSSTAGFVEKVSPSTAVVSAGYANRWGFPVTEVVERFTGAGARIVNTARAGAVTVELESSAGPIVRRFRDRERWLWNR